MTTEMRLERFERENSRLKRWGGLSLCVVAGLALLGQAAPTEKVVRAERFELADKGGKVQASLGFNANGTPVFRLFDADGTASASLSGAPDGGAALSLSRGNGEHRSMYAQLPDGTTNLCFMDKNKKIRLCMGVDGDGSPSLMLCDNTGMVRAVLGVTELEALRTGGTEKTAPSSLVLFDKDGKVIFRAPQ